jgi:hypothetical protein
MWTEVTKDLVIREAIDQMGYSCEETDDFFYVMEYLKYVRFDPSVWIRDILTPCRRTFYSLWSCQMSFVVSASFASISSVQLSVTHRDRRVATMRSSTNAKCLTIAAASVIAKPP